MENARTTVRIAFMLMVTSYTYTHFQMWSIVFLENPFTLNKNLELLKLYDGSLS